MKTIYYYYNATGTLFLSYSDGNGGYADEAYVFYSLREAIQKFRRSYGLQDELSNQVQHKERFSMNKSCGVW